MRKSILFVFLTYGLFVSLTCFAQGYLQLIQGAGNECLGAVALLKSGDVIAVGSDSTSNDALLMKLDRFGIISRANRISGSGADEAQAVVATSDGGAVVVGSTSSFGEGNLDAFLFKVRPSGTIAWKRTFGTSGNEHFVRIVQTSDRGFIVLGDADHDPNLNDIVVAKFNSHGRPVWNKVISGGSFDHASDLQLTSDDGAIVAIAAEFPDGIRSILAKFSANGTVEWSRIYGSTDNHVALSAFETADGDYYFTEIFTPSGSQKSRTILSKLDSAGIPVWSRSYKSRGANLIASVTSIRQDESLLLAGNITSSNGDSKGILVGLDENGKIQWRKKVKLDSRPVFIGRPFILSADESILVAGCVGERASNDMDSILLKLQGNGIIQGGCSKLKKFPLSTARFNLTSTEFVLDEIPVPFSTASAGFSFADPDVGQSPVCFRQ